MMCKPEKWKLSDDDKLKIKDYTVNKAAQYAAILAELRHKRDIYDRNLRDIALAVAMADVDDAIVGMALHYQKTIFVYNTAIQGMTQQFNEVMQLDFPELEGAERWDG